MKRCAMCGCVLGQVGRPLSSDCGGDCWGCISAVEADAIGVDLEVYRKDPVGCIKR